VDAQGKVASGPFGALTRLVPLAGLSGQAGEGYLAGKLEFITL
jgi:hypothetical protein